MSRLIPVKNRVQHKKAMRLLKEQLQIGSEECKGKVLGFQAGNIPCDIWWNKKHDFWYYLKPDKDILSRTKYSSKKNQLKSKSRINRTVLFLGLGNPKLKRNLNITVEISMPLDSLSMQVAGCLLLDSKEDFFIGHSGKIGGGRKGIGLTAFASWYPEDPFPVDWEGKIRDLLFITKIKSRTFQSELKDFVSRVKEFKEDVKEDTKGPKASIHKSPEKSYAKEFSGLRKTYTVEQQIQAKVTHGHVVHELKKQLEKRFKTEVYSDNRRDLYIDKSRGVKPMIFEIKTGVSSSDLVKAVGQLFYYPACFEMDKNTKRVLVIPNDVNETQVNDLNSLGVKVLKYKLTNKVRFYGLDKLLNS